MAELFTLLPAASRPGSRDYVGYFCNEFSEEMLFVQSAGEPAILRHQERDYEAITVVEQLGLILTPGFLLDGTETLWLTANWFASTALRAHEPPSLRHCDRCDHPQLLHLPTGCICTCRETRSDAIARDLGNGVPI